MISIPHPRVSCCIATVISSPHITRYIKKVWLKKPFYKFYHLTILRTSSNTTCGLRSLGGSRSPRGPPWGNGPFHYYVSRNSRHYELPARPDDEFVVPNPEFLTPDGDFGPAKSRFYQILQCSTPSAEYPATRLPRSSPSELSPSDSILYRLGSPNHDSTTLLYLETRKRLNTEPQGVAAALDPTVR